MFWNEKPVQFFQKCWVKLFDVNIVFFAVCSFLLYIEPDTPSHCQEDITQRSTPRLVIKVSWLLFAHPAPNLNFRYGSQLPISLMAAGCWAVHVVLVRSSVKGDPSGKASCGHITYQKKGQTYTHISFLINFWSCQLKHLLLKVVIICLWMFHFVHFLVIL